MTRSPTPREVIVLSPVEGSADLRSPDHEELVASRFMPSVERRVIARLRGTQLGSGTLLAATHGLGVARSVDSGGTWAWSSDGLPQFDLRSARSALLG